MENKPLAEQPNDERLWRMAKKRAAFKQHLSIYVLVNVFLWGVWWFTSGQYDQYTGPVAWPAWTTLGWGLGLAFHYFNAYGEPDQKSAVEREYEKLKAQQNR